MRMTRVSTTDIRNDLANVVNRVAYGGERVVLDRRGKDVAAIVSMDDLRRLEEMENTFWSSEAEKALAEAKRKSERPIPFEQVERKLDVKRAKRRRGAQNGRK